VLGIVDNPARVPQISAGFHSSRNRKIPLPVCQHCLKATAMKKTKRVRTAKSRNAREALSGRPGGPTRKRLKRIAGDVMRQERRDRRALDRQAERAAKVRKPDTK
jgi:hypothetical protein